MTTADLNRLVGDPTECYSCRHEPCLCSREKERTRRYMARSRWLWDNFISPSALGRTTASSDRAAQLADATAWWRSEWEIKNREAEWLWRVCFLLAFLCGLCFFVGTLI